MTVTSDLVNIVRDFHISRPRMVLKYSHYVICKMTLLDVFNLSALVIVSGEV